MHHRLVIPDLIRDPFQIISVCARSAISIALLVMGEHHLPMQRNGSRLGGRDDEASASVTVLRSDRACVSVRSSANRSGGE